MKTFDELLFELSERKAMSTFDRKKIGMRMSRMMKSSAVKAKIARAKLKKASDSKLKQRANKAAKFLVIKKFTGVDANAYANLPLVQRQMIDNKILAKKGAALKKIATKLLPKVKKSEIERLQKAKQGAKE